jgi:hypothetical protein
VGRNRIGKSISDGCGPPDVKAAPPRSTRNTADQNRLNLAEGGLLVYKAGGIGKYKGNPVVKKNEISEFLAVL